MEPLRKELLVQNGFFTPPVVPLQGSFGHRSALRPLCLGYVSIRQTDSQGLLSLLYQMPAQWVRAYVSGLDDGSPWNRGGWEFLCGPFLSDVHPPDASGPTCNVSVCHKSWDLDAPYTKHSYTEFFSIFIEGTLAPPGGDKVARWMD